MLDFTASPAIVRTVVEGERLSLGHLANPAFATELAQIDPLPHQRLAVYQHLLPQTRLRFLLADDAGAGKTIMAGLYIRELLSRRLIRRVLIVPPAGLVGNWQRELQTLFSLTFTIVSGADAKAANPFVSVTGDQVIVSLDTLTGERVFGRLREEATEPYDLVIFDEAHKLAADRNADFSVRRTDRYQLAEALAGVPGLDAGWTLPWRTHHLLLLTATPHMGKDYPWFALWRLLDPWVFTTPRALAEYPIPQRSRYFLRRVKEEMLTLDGRPLYPTRIADTLGYALQQGAISEQTLYDQTPHYLENIYNRAKLLNRSAAKLAMSVFQRRLASSTWALLRSFERRLEKLEALIAEVRQSRLSMVQLTLLQQNLDQQANDPFDDRTADEEQGGDGLEENEPAEDRLLQSVIADSLADLEIERARVAELLDLARQVYTQGDEAKFVRLREVLRDARYVGEKFLIFTEHRDTLEFLVKRLDGLGYAGQTAQIHGGMDYRERERQVEEFRRPLTEGGARFLICTDAAGEGINLQFCWLMFNYQ
jgi:superfamily II DNA or RNA helicase